MERKASSHTPDVVVLTLLDYDHDLGTERLIGVYFGAAAPLTLTPVHGRCR